MEIVLDSKFTLTYGHFNWINLVLSTDLPFQGKAICLYLSTFMNSQQDVAWPSQGRIVKELGIPHSTLNRFLNVIEESGWIVRDRGNSTTSTRYHIAFPKHVEKELLGSPRAGLGSPSTGLGNPTAGLQVVPERDTNKQLNKQSNSNDRFAEFWDLYPRKVAKPKAHASWKAATKLSESKQQEVLDGLKKHLPSLKGKEQQYIPHPTTWLNGMRWADPVEPPKQSADEWRLYSI